MLKIKDPLHERDLDLGCFEGELSRRQGLKATPTTPTTPSAAQAKQAK